MWDYFFGTTSKLNLLLQKVELLSTSVTRLEKAMHEEMDALSKRLDAATNKLATILQGIKDQLKEGMSKAEVEALKSKLTAPIEQLEAMGTDPADPVPSEKRK